MNKTMTRPLAAHTRPEISVIRHASRLLRPRAPKLQARRITPRVFCDPRMPGNWQNVDEPVEAQVCQAA